MVATAASNPKKSKFSKPNGAPKKFGSQKFNKKNVNSAPTNKDNVENFDQLSQQLSKKLSKLRLKKVPKEEKEKEITFIINNCFHASKNNSQILLKKRVIECFHFSLKYGNDSQRCRLQELFELNLDLYLACPKAKLVIKYLFSYANASRREFLVKVLANKTSKLVLTKNLGETLNEVFTEYLTVKQKYMLIKDLFGKHYALFEVNNPKASFMEYGSDPLFESGLEDIKKLVLLYSSKSVVHTPIVHFFLLKIHQISPKLFHTQLLPTIFDCCFDSKTNETEQNDADADADRTFCSTHYGCELIARIIHFQHANSDQYSDYQSHFEHIHTLLRAHMTNILKFSGGLAIVKTLTLLPEYQQTLVESLWNPFVSDISSYVGNVSGDSQYCLNLLESLPASAPVNNSTVNPKNKSCLQTFINSVGSFSSLCEGDQTNYTWIRNETVDFHCAVIRDKLAEHFVRNSQLIPTEHNYGFTFAQWRPLIDQGYINQIYHNIINYLNVPCNESVAADNDKTKKSSPVTGMWFDEKPVTNVIKKIISVENLHSTIPMEQRLSTALLENIDVDTMCTWLAHHSGVHFLLMFVKTSHPTKALKVLVENLKAVNNEFFNSKL